MVGAFNNLSCLPVPANREENSVWETQLTQLLVEGLHPEIGTMVKQTCTEWDTAGQSERQVAIGKEKKTVPKASEEHNLTWPRLTTSRSKDEGGAGDEAMGVDNYSVEAMPQDVDNGHQVMYATCVTPKAIGLVTAPSDPHMQMIHYGIVLSP